jgi:arginyl-tRNA synthetase
MTEVQTAFAKLSSEPSSLAAQFSLERPPQPQFGDYSTNAAMLAAGTLKRSPREIAQQLGEKIEQTMGPALTKFAVAGPGFLNLFVADSWLHASLQALLTSRSEAKAGSDEAKHAERILIEFVSANPTGPLTAAGGRHAAYGDALANLLAFVGHRVEREYYVNDFGSQVLALGRSIAAHAKGEPLPADGYAGDYVQRLANEIPNAVELDPQALAVKGVELMVDDIRATLERFGVSFDNWFHERELHQGSDNAVRHAYHELEKRDELYRAQGALWLRSTKVGDDKDRVLERSNGEPTYLASDVAYHQHKRERGFDRMIDVLGADHHGYVQRLKASFAALGGDPERLEVVIMQLVNLLERGERAAMSKRRGEFVTLDELIDQIGVDAARFFLLQRSHDTTVDLDLELAREQSSENPVYYVQYAHARIASILRRAGQARIDEAIAQASELQPKFEPAERILIK